jgi:hypothetical protein
MIKEVRADVVTDGAGVTGASAHGAAAGLNVTLVHTGYYCHANGPGNGARHRAASRY